MPRNSQRVEHGHSRMCMHILMHACEDRHGHAQWTQTPTHTCACTLRMDAMYDTFDVHNGLP